MTCGCCFSCFRYTVTVFWTDFCDNNIKILHSASAALVDVGGVGECVDLHFLFLLLVLLLITKMRNSGTLAPQTTAGKIWN